MDFYYCCLKRYVAETRLKKSYYIKKEMNTLVKEINEYHFEVCEELQFELQERVSEERQVIIHFSVLATDEEDAARIWKSTFLIDAVTGIRYPMLFAEGISIAPEWTIIPKNRPLHFTLIFKGLPQRCKRFDLLEMIPEPGGFEMRNIHRNTSDVYFVEM